MLKWYGMIKLVGTLPTKLKEEKAIKNMAYQGFLEWTTSKLIYFEKRKLCGCMIPMFTRLLGMNMNLLINRIEPGCHY